MCKKMCKNITLNDVKNSAFLANESYNNFPNGKEVTNPATGSSFEVVEQKNEITNINVIGEVELGFSNII
ncbi:MAG: hypothetical protein MR658_05090 [Campylobacter sp.]|uniref:hypothetical protein n=1 Tax=Campylobacter sp. TaxID=205 RepID=UPI002A47BE3F|nr:hypothetical protein [Campylobacter sp.]MDD6925105.1 hypothetical protein [Campylobacteraceae bacterium]MCI6178182.1 hypothetical protein [Campylobacter sp.]MCI7501101.1 hypothetical protein [Campylobacter sp.]MDD7091331.1 hypothetical protein [Campylobacteraceae bacterium]MDY3246562.1 hypothetical protein [Campylobacter sp.]